MSIKREKPMLSKGILDMKFMKRTKIKVDKEAEEAESRAMYAQEITDKMRNTESKYIIEPSFILCAGLVDGRFSCRGMNPEIEKLLEQEKAEQAAAKRHEQAVDVSDTDMAKFYYAQKVPAAYKSMNRKFERSTNKRKITNDMKKAKFLKPKETD